MSKKNPQKWVITCEPQSLKSRYYGEDGKCTFYNRAAEFFTFEQAQEWALSHGIKPDGAMVSIVIKRKIIDR